MEKIKYIKGNQEHAREIENYFVSMGAELARHYSYAMESFAYFVNPDTGCVDGYSVDSWEFKAFVEAGVFEELKYPYVNKTAKPKLKVVQGVPDRGNEVIALLESLGGKNFYHFEGRFDNVYYFIDSDGCIYMDGMACSFFDNYELEILTLPEKEEPAEVGPVKSGLEVVQESPLYDVETVSNEEKEVLKSALEALTLPVAKPKLKVIKGVDGKGDEVIELLVSLGGINDGIWFGNGDDGYYFIGDDGHIKYDDIDCDFFKDYELEILTLPEKVEKPKLQVIQGVKDRGEEVIALLKSLGGDNIFRLWGEAIKSYYYIDRYKAIRWGYIDDDFFKGYELEVLTLPEGNNPKLKVIQGDPCRGNEVIERLVSMGGKNTIPLFGRSPQDYYYINNFGCIEGHVKNHKFFDDFELEIMTLPEKIERPKLQVIQGVPGRGDEVIALLESLGGVNRNNCIGNLKGLYYFIDPRNPDNAINYLGNVQMSLFFKDYDIDVITLPEKVEKPKMKDTQGDITHLEKVEKPKMKVIKGDPDRGAEVIKALEAIGGCNSNGYEGRNDSCYYFIDASCDGKSIMYLLCGADFFKDYDLEILTLPDEAAKPKLQVVRGNFDRRHEVIKLLESLGGINEHGYEAYDEDCYYFIDPRTNEKIIDFFNYKKTCFFDDYDLEVLTLPGEEESPKEPETAKFEPFVSKVLVRNNPGYLWMPAFFFSEESEGGARWYHIVGTHDTYRECIPYEGNEELAFTSNDVRVYKK